MLLFNLSILRRKKRIMKKALFLFALLGLMALPMFAGDFSFGGDLTFGVISDFDTNENEASDVKFDIKSAVDDHNSVTIEFDLENLDLELARCSTNIGTWLELPVGLKLDWGLVKPNANRFVGVSERGNEKIYQMEELYWGINLLATVDFIEIELAFNPGKTVADTGDIGCLLAGIAAKEPIAGLNAELYYYQNEVDNLSTMDQGIIGVSANYSTDLSGFGLKVGLGMKYDMLTEDEVDAEMTSIYYGFGLKGTYSIATLTIGLDGNDTDALAGLTATIAVAPVDMATIYAGLEMNLTEAAADAVDAETRDSSLDGIDAGVQIKMGAASLYIGYLLTDVGEGKWKAPNTMTFVNTDGETENTGGMYFKFDIDL
jgi:hypothetical protein